MSKETNRLRSCLKQHHLFCILAGISIFLFFFELGSRSLKIKDALRYCLKVGFKPLMATIKREFLTRVNNPVTNSEPFYYYFVTIWADFLPWSLFIPLAAIYAYKKWRVGDEYITFIFCWAALVFTFLCVVKAKHPRYMLPLYPALSILMAALIDDTLKFPIQKIEDIRPNPSQI